MSRRERLGLVLLLALGVLLRSIRLQYPGLWVDEAESAINALTILDTGLPRDRYQGLPVYENTLVETTPEDPEYEFRDSSYSRRGLAVYHGWLPLYAMAGSLALFGVQPNAKPAVLAPQFSVEENDRRTIAARVPSVLFGLAYLVGVFFAGREMFGRDMGWAALVFAAFARPLVNYGRQARYYSAAICLAVFAGWMLWRLLQRNRRRDGVLAGLAFAALFHSHVLSFATAAILAGLAFLCTGRWRERLVPWSIFAGLVAIAVVPYVQLTGLLEQARAVPKAWPLLQFPHDVLLYPRTKVLYLVPLSLAFAAMTVARLRPSWLPARIREPLRAAFAPGLLLMGWLAVGYAAFLFLTPAASYFVQRATLPLADAGTLLIALTIAALARACWPSARPRRAALVALVFAIFAGSGPFGGYWPGPYPSAAQGAVEVLRNGEPLAPDTRLYSTPNEQLPLTYYSGLPFQSLAPIRKSFLDSYPGPILMIDATGTEFPTTMDVLDIGARLGQTLSEGEARALRLGVPLRLSMERARQRGATLMDAPPEPAPLESAILARMHELAPEQLAGVLEDNPAIFRGFALQDWADWWPVFFLRFADPRSRMGPRMNIAERLVGARARIVPSGWTLYFIPRRAER